jgi:putative DNA primase/helicase
MASNESMKSTDATSGLERRRLTVRFPRSFTPEEKAEWFRQGGEEKVLHTEIPGLFRWLLAMPVEEIHHRINNPPHRVAADNLLGMKANNSVAHWIMERTIPVSNPDDKEDYIQIGMKKEIREAGLIVVANTDKWAYANYLAFCYETGRPPVSLVSFASTAVDMGETLGAHVVKKNHPITRGAALYGLRLRKQMTLEQYKEYCKQESLEYKDLIEMPLEKAHDWTRTPLPPGAS